MSLNPRSPQTKSSQAQAELIDCLLTSSTISYPWNPAEPETADYYIESDRHFSLDEWSDVDEAEVPAHQHKTFLDQESHQGRGDRHPTLPNFAHACGFFYQTSTRFPIQAVPRCNLGIQACRYPSARRAIPRRRGACWRFSDGYWHDTTGYRKTAQYYGHMG